MTTKTDKSAAGTVAETVPVLDLSGVTTLDEAMALVAASGISVEQIEDYGDGFTLLPTDEKETLKGVPFLIVDGGERIDGQTERAYWSFRIVTNDGRKLIVNDGSVGLMRQAQQIAEKRGGTVAGLVVKNGLTGGAYTTTITNSKGEQEKVSASTYYFAGV